MQITPRVMGVRRCGLILIAAMIGSSACDKVYRNAMLDIPISADASTRSPPFRLYSDQQYQILIGLDPMKVDTATCAANYAARGVNQPPKPCDELRAPVKEIHWTVTQNGKFIAEGSLPGEPTGDPGYRDNKWTKSKKSAWLRYPGWYGHRGKDYVIEISLQSASIDLQPFHPRLAIIEPW